MRHRALLGWAGHGWVFQIQVLGTKCQSAWTQKSSMAGLKWLPKPISPEFVHIRSDLSGPVLRDTARLSQRYPPIVRYGVFGVSTWPIGCDTPSPFSERFPLGEHAKWRCDTPPQKGISAIPARYPMKTRQMGAIPPSAILSRKGVARYGGVSRTGPLRI